MSRTIWSSPKKLIQIIVPFFSGLFLIGISMSLFNCSAAKFWSIASVNTAQNTKKDIIFDQKNQLASDIYYTSPQEQKGTVIFIYGGNWRSGDKSMYRFLADGLVKFGYNVVIPNYRLFPRTAYPGFVQDIATFTQWLK